jgi:hypothetical protein
MAQQTIVGSPSDAPPQAAMRPPPPAVDLSWAKSLDTVVFSRSKKKVISESSSSIRAELPLLSGAGDTVFTVSFESSDRDMRQLSAQLKSADGKTVYVEFARPAMERTAGNMLFSSLSGNTKPCQVIVAGELYATLIGSELMQDCQLQKVGNTGGLKFGKGPCCICCCAIKQNLDDFTGQTVAVAKVDNGCGFPCPCIPNTGQRCTVEMPSDQTTKLDVLLLTIIKVIGMETVSPHSGGGGG